MATGRFRLATITANITPDWSKVYAINKKKPHLIKTSLRNILRFIYFLSKGATYTAIAVNRRITGNLHITQPLVESIVVAAPGARDTDQPTLRTQRRYADENMPTETENRISVSEPWY